MTRTDYIARFVEGNPKLTYEQIGRRFGISRQRVHQIAEKHGMRRRARYNFTLAEIVGLYYGEELTMKEVGARLGCSKDLIGNHLRKAGLSPKETDLQRRRRHSVQV